MKGDPRIIDTLNALLASELTAVNQYIVHSELAANWGYDKLAAYVKGRAVAEMKHAEALIERIVFLEGMPVVSVLRPITIGPDVPRQLSNDHALEAEAVGHYNTAIDIAVELHDSVTRELLERILRDEDEHVSAIEALQDQIQQMGPQVFLSTQV